VRFWFMRQPWVQVPHVPQSVTRHNSDSEINSGKSVVWRIKLPTFYATVQLYPVDQFDKGIVSQHLSQPAIELLATLTPFSWSHQETSTLPVTSTDKQAESVKWIVFFWYSLVTFIYGKTLPFKSGKLALYLKVNYWVNYCINKYYSKNSCFCWYG